MKISAIKEDLKQEYYSWLNKNQVAYKAVISKAIDAVYEVHSTNRVSCNDLKSLSAGLELPYLFSYPLGEYCCNFASTHPPIRDLILELSQHPLARTRLNILILCFYNKPKEIVDVILRNGLNDRSKIVREKSLDIICRLNKRHLKADILKRLNVEKNIEVKRLSEMSYGLMDKGYVVSPFDKGKVIIQLTNGGQSGPFVSDSDLEDMVSLEKKIAEIRNLK